MNDHILDEHPRHKQILNSALEHLEMDYLKAIGEGPGWPVFYIADLTDPSGLKFAHQVHPAEMVEDQIISARVRGVAPILIYCRVLVDHYDVGDHWWKGCGFSRFPICVVTEGLSVVVGRSVPPGIDTALRRQLLQIHTALVVQTFRTTREAAPLPVVVSMIDLTDELGREAATSIGGVDLASQGNLLLLAGSPVLGFPEGWEDPIPEGHIPVQVIAYGGILLTSIPDVEPVGA